MGINGTAADGDQPIHMVDTKDVAVIAARHLALSDFTGKGVHAVMGPRNYTLREATGIAGNAIGNPALPYVQLPADQVKQTFLNNGFSEDFTDNLIAMASAMKNGFMNYQKRDAGTTTSTTLEVFAAEVYAPAFNKQ